VPQTCRVLPSSGTSAAAPTALPRVPARYPEIEGCSCTHEGSRRKAWGSGCGARRWPEPQWREIQPGWRAQHARAIALKRVQQFLAEAQEFLQQHRVVGKYVHAPPRVVEGWRAAELSLAG